MYFSSLISFLSLVIQFPLVLTALKYSNSYRQIRQLIQNVSENDIIQIVRPNKNDESSIEKIERNKLILLKDIGVFSIKENDWGVPQTIINGLYNKLIKPLNEKTSEVVVTDNSTAFCFVLNHFKNVAISEIDYITVRVTASALYQTHLHYAKNKIRILRNSSVDEVLKDMFRLLIADSSFFQLQPDILRNTSSIIREHLNSMEYSDDELPTSDYRFINIDKHIEYKHDTISNYWFYVKNDLPDLFFEPLNLSLNCRNQNVYDYFSIHVHGLFSDIFSSKLTDSQKNELFEQFSYKARTAQNNAISNDIFENIDIYSNTQIEIWLTQEQKIAWSALFEMSSLIERLNEKNRGTLYLDDLFFIARSMSHKNISQKIKLEVLQYIIEKGFKLYNSDISSDFTKSEVVKQLKWLVSMIKSEEDLKPLIENYSERIEALT
ncbi:MAG: hypothetical protein DCF13_13575 [Flavobacteriaceae bacterium]|nr:MAG: hypothetical protein DCF13_13575 [Flavobacteriaceae bacterium]